MNAKKRRHPYSARRRWHYAYPNAAEPGYFAGKLLDGLTALVTGMGTVTVMIFLLLVF